MKLKLMSMAAMALSALLCLTTTGAWAQEVTLLTTIESAGDTWDDATKTLTVNSNLPENAYKDQTVIEHVIISSGVTSVGNSAFYGCTGMETVTINATTPPTLGSDAFEDTAEGLKIYVPAGSVDTYKAAWAAYANKIEATAPAPTYTVTLKEGTDDASNWQGKAGEGEYQALPLEGVAAGTAVTVKYNGTKKVKSVKAKKKVKPAATVTTAPTAKTGVKAGQNEAIVNAGTAEGGTMMYMVNATQPASTNGFSATVPTSAGLTAGTYYVWYYVKADDSHTDSQISATGIEVTIAAASLIVNPAVGQVIGDDGKNYDYASLPGGVTAVAKICYVSGEHGLALALADETGTMNWSTAISTCAAHTPAITGGTWKLATQDEWNNMITAAGSDEGYEALRDGFSSVGGSNLQSAYYWSSTENGSDLASIHGFEYGDWGHHRKDADYIWVRACLAF